MKKSLILSAMLAGGFMAVPMMRASAIEDLVKDANTAMTLFNQLKSNAGKYQASANDKKKSKAERAQAIVGFFDEGIKFTAQFLMVTNDLVAVLESLGLKMVTDPVKAPLAKASDVVDQIKKGSEVIKGILPKN